MQNQQQQIIERLLDTPAARAAAAELEAERHAERCKLRDRIQAIEQDRERATSAARAEYDAAHRLYLKKQIEFVKARDDMQRAFSALGRAKDTHSREQRELQLKLAELN